MYLLLLFNIVCAFANPFVGHTFYVNPTFQKDIDSSMSGSDSTTLRNLQISRNVPSAYWLDVMSKAVPLQTSLASMEGILMDAGKHNPPHLVVFIVYDLPNRDCNAIASNGELCCTKKSDGTCDYRASGNCESGLALYRQYIDNIASILKRYTNVPTVLVIEPDSLPNLVTNMGNPSCSNQATQTSYREGIKYAVNTIKSASPAVEMYLDAGHGGWLGWQNNAQPFAELVRSMNILDKIRGFATNVANYQPLGKPCPAPLWCLPSAGNTGAECCSDGCNLVNQWNPANNEHNYVLELSSLFPGEYFIIDTGRNAVPNARANCANWCNPRDTGMGLLPTTKTDLKVVDAYYWLKTPGESDGCTEILPEGGRCNRFDSMCASADSIGSRSGEPRAPQAGKWFDYQIKMLAKNANFGSVIPPTPLPTPVPTPVPTPAVKKWKCKQCLQR
jgi:cellulose 1,4-beta-cellobiosidase